MMNLEVKQKWVAALRSGEYKQGVWQLHNQATDEYCCLGVLCELAVQEGAVPFYRGGAAVMPTDVRDWAELDSHDPVVVSPNRGEALYLSNVNDVCNLPFAEIADLIEKDL